MRQVLDVLDPVAVRLQTVHLLAEVPDVPNGHRLVVRTGGEHATVQEPENRKTSGEVGGISAMILPSITQQQR